MRSCLTELTLNGAPASSCIGGLQDAHSAVSRGDRPEHVAVDRDAGDFHPGQHPHERALHVIEEVPCSPTALEMPRSGARSRPSSEADQRIRRRPGPAGTVVLDLP